MIDLPVNPETGLPMLVLRQSDFKQYLTDRRDFYYSVFLNLEPTAKKVTVADVGTFVHSGLEAYYRSAMTGIAADPLAAIVAEADKAVEENPILTGELADAANLARIMVEGYIQWLEVEALDHGMKILSVEERITAFIGVFSGIEVYVSGQLDVVKEDDHGLIWVDDHKTVDQFKPAIQILSVDFQGQTYDFLLRSKGIEPVGFRHNQLRRVKRTAAAKPPFYNRHEVTFTAQQRKTHELHLIGLAAEIALRYEIMKPMNKAERETAMHIYFPPFFTRDSTWRSNFLSASILADTDPESASDMLAGSYKQKDAA